MEAALLTLAHFLSFAAAALSAVAIALGLVHAVMVMGRRALRGEALPGTAARIALGRWLVKCSPP